MYTDVPLCPMTQILIYMAVVYYCVQTVYRLCTDCVRTVYRLCTGCVQTVYRLCTDFVQTVYRTVFLNCTRDYINICAKDGKFTVDKSCSNVNDAIKL